MALLAVSLVAQAFASNANKTFQGNGNGNGNASGNDNSIVNSNNGNSVVPGAGDIVSVTKGKKVSVDSATITWGAVELTGGSILSGTSANTLNLVLSASTASSTWTGGEINSSTVSTASTAGLVIGAGAAGDDAKKINNGGKLKLGGTTTWNADAIGIASSASLENSSGATFTTSFDGTITNDGGATGFINGGTFTKSNGNGGANATDIQTAFTNTGNVNASSGTLLLSGGGSSSAGTITVGSGAKLKTNGNNFNFTGGTLNSASDGAIEIAGATTSFSGTTGTANVTVSGTGTANFSGAHSSSGKLSLTAGTVSGTGGAQFGALDWSGGSLNGKVQSNGATNLTGSGKSISGGDLTLAGATSWDGSQISSGSNAKIKNSAGVTFSANADGLLSNSGGTVFTNDGTFEKTAGSGGANSTEIQAQFNSSGTGSIKATTGNLKLTGGGSSAGGVTVGNGAKLQISGTDYAFSGGALNSTGTGAIEVSSATASFGGTTGSANVNVNGTGTANFSGAHSSTGKLSLSAGTVSGTGGAQFGALDWSGGSLNGNVQSNGATTINGSGKSIAGGDLTLGGATSWDGSQISTGSNAKIKNSAGVTFSASADGILTNSGGTVFTNDGTFEKTLGEGGASSTEIQAQFNSSVTGSIKATKGNLKLTGGGSSAGGVTVGSGAKLQLGGNNYAFTGGTLNSASDGAIEIGSATTSFSGTSGTANVTVNGTGTASFSGTHTSSGKLSLSSGTLSGAGSAEFGSLDWSGGNLNGTVKSNGATTINGSGKNISGGDLTLGGTTSWDGTQISTGGNAKIKNSTGVTFSVFADGVLTNSGGTVFTNDGTFEKTGGSGGATSTEIQAQFNSSATGNIKATGGNLKLTGGGSSAGGVTVGGGAKLQLGGNNYAFTGGTLNSASDGAIEIGSATTSFSGTTGSANLNVNGTGTANFGGAHTSSGKLSLSSGTVSGTGGAEFGTLDWSGGNLNGKVKSNGATTISGGAKNLAGGDLTLGGATSWDGSQISTGGNAKIKNSAGVTFSASADGVLTNSGGTVFTNDGTFEKTNGNGGANSTEIQAQFNSSATGNIKATNGNLKLTGGGSSSGNVTVGNGAKLQVSGTNYDFTGGVLNSVSNGAIEISSATASFSGTSGSANLNVNGTGTATFSGAHSSSGKLSLSSGTVSGTGGAEFGSLDWSGGSLNGKVKSNGATTINGSGKSISGGDLTLGGATSWDGSQISTGANAKIKNSAGVTFSASADGILTNSGGTVFTNDGTFEKTNGNGGANSTEIQAQFTSSGTGNIKATGGNLKLTGGGSSSGNVVVGHGAKLQISDNNFDFTGGTLNSETDGAIEVSSATASFSGTSGNANLNVNGTGNAKFNGNHSTSGKLTFSGGTIDGTGLAEVGSLDWSGGDLNGKVKSNGNASIGGGAKNLAGELTLGGTTDWDGSQINGSSGTKLKNSAGGNFKVNADGIIANSGGASFTNDGTFNKSGGTGTTEIQAGFENNGQLNIGSGHLKLSGSSKNGSSGKISIAALAQLDINGDLNLDALSELKGNGTAKLLNGNLTANGKIDVASFSFDGGEFLGTNEFTGVVDWNNGHWNSLTAGAVTTIDAGSILNLNASDHEFNNRSIHNRGIVNWQAGNLRGGNGSDFLNDTGAVFNDLNKGNKSLQAPGTFGGSASFTNNGTYHKQGDGQTTIDVLFTNNNALSVDAGTLRFTGSFHQASGSLYVAAGATAKFDNGLNFAAGTLSGSGTLDGNVVSGGTLSPGSSPGMLTITGGLTLALNSVSVFEIGGTAQGTTYDFVSVGGASVLGGTLQLKFYNGFNTTIQASDVFTIMNASGGLSGTFANVSNGGRLFTSDNVGSFQVNYADPAFGVNTVVLSSFAPIPEPSTWALMLSGLAFFGWKLRRRRR